MVYLLVFTVLVLAFLNLLLVEYCTWYFVALSTFLYLIETLYFLDFFDNFLALLTEDIFALAILSADLGVDFFPSLFK